MPIEHSVRYANWLSGGFAVRRALPMLIQPPKEGVQLDGELLSELSTPAASHIWIISGRDIDDPALLQQGVLELTAAEMTRAAGFRRPQDRDRFIVGRWMLRQLLGAYSSTLPSKIAFAIDQFGRPRLANPKVPIQFNLSHTDGMVACAFTLGSEIGIDVERLRPDSFDIDIASNYFSEAACRDILNAPQNARVERFFEYWVLTEAYAKARGKGLTLPAPLSFSVEDADRGRIQVVASEGANLNGWHFYLIWPTAEHRMAVASAGGQSRPPIVRKLRRDGFCNVVYHSIASCGPSKT